MNHKSLSTKCTDVLHDSTTEQRVTGNTFPYNMMIFICTMLAVSSTNSELYVDTTFHILSIYRVYVFLSFLTYTYTYTYISISISIFYLMILT